MRLVPFLQRFRNHGSQELLFEPCAPTPTRVLAIREEISQSIYIYFDIIYIYIDAYIYTYIDMYSNPFILATNTNLLT